MEADTTEATLSTLNVETPEDVKRFLGYTNLEHPRRELYGREHPPTETLSNVILGAFQCIWRHDQTLKADISETGEVVSLSEID